MANVGGLRPTQNDQPEVRQKKGRLVVQMNSSNRASLRPSAAPVDTYVRPGATPDVSSNAERLSAALAQLNPAIGQIARQYQKGKEEDQLAKLRFYTEQFMQDKESGAVSAAQVKEMFPELVPTVAARIAQATGEIEARRWVQGQIQTILENDDIRLNTANRQAAIEAIREEARGMIGDNEFYGTGFLTQLDSSLREFETAWMRETAAHQEQIQAESFSNHVTNALVNGGDLMELDAQWRDSSSLNNLERNKIVVDTAISQALATGNEALLSRVPDRFLNAESKARIEQTRDQIQQTRYIQYYRQRQMEQWAREDQIRNGKIDILTRTTGGEEVPPAEFAYEPELFEYVARMATQPKVNDTYSVRMAASFKSNLIRAGTTGSYKDAFQNDPIFQMRFESDDDVTEETLRDFVLDHPELNSREKQDLINSIPQLMEGNNFMLDKDVTNALRSVEEDVRAFVQSPLGGDLILQTRGINVQSVVQREFEDYLIEALSAEIEEGNSIPTGHLKRRYIREAKEAALNRLQMLQQQALPGMYGGGQQTTPKGGGQMSRNNNRSNESNDTNIVNWGDLE